MEDQGGSRSRQGETLAHDAGLTPGKEEVEGRRIGWEESQTAARSTKVLEHLQTPVNIRGAMQPARGAYARSSSQSVISGSSLGEVVLAQMLQGIQRAAAGAAGNHAAQSRSELLMSMAATVHPGTMEICVSIFGGPLFLISVAPVDLRATTCIHPLLSTGRGGVGGGGLSP